MHLILFGSYGNRGGIGSEGGKCLWGGKGLNGWKEDSLILIDYR